MSRGQLKVLKSRKPEAFFYGRAEKKLKKKREETGVISRFLYPYYLVEYEYSRRTRILKREITKQHLMFLDGHVPEPRSETFFRMGFKRKGDLEAALYEKEAEEPLFPAISSHKLEEALRERLEESCKETDRLSVEIDDLHLQRKHIKDTIRTLKQNKSANEADIAESKAESSFINKKIRIKMRERNRRLGKREKEFALRKEWNFLKFIDALLFYHPFWAVKYKGQGRKGTEWTRWVVLDGRTGKVVFDSLTNRLDTKLLNLSEENLDTYIPLNDEE